MDKKTLALLLASINSTESYSKEEIDDMISQLKQFEAKKVAKLPATGQIPNCIYFVPKGTTGVDGCNEFMWIDNKWEYLGSTDVDLSDYWTIDETKAYIEANKYVLPAATEDTLGGIKLNSNGSVTLDENGNIVIASISNEDIENLFSA